MTANWGSAARLGTWKLEQRGQLAPAGRRAWTHWPAPRGQRALLDQISSKAAAQRQWFAARTPCDVARSGHRSRLRAGRALHPGNGAAVAGRLQQRARLSAAALLATQGAGARPCGSCCSGALEARIPGLPSQAHRRGSAARDSSERERGIKRVS